MSISELCEPAIYYANQGVVITPRVSFDWLNSYKNLKGIAKKYYLNKGKPFKTGEIFYAPKQAEVLKIFSKNGAKGFYEGEVVDDLISSLNKLGGKHTYEDFSNFTVEYVEPVMEKFEDYELYELPPNCQGIVAILLKKLMDHFSLSSLDPLGSNRVHIEAECAKIAYNFRNKILGDPNYYHLNYENFFATTNIEYHVNKINLNNANNDINTHWHGNHKDTVYLTVVDKNRMMVSLIFSIFNSFGSGYASEKYGLIFHNRGAGFSLMKGHPNELVGGKRPLHTIIPAFLSKSNDFYMPFGVMGGQYQANGHARLISNVIDYGMDIQQAIDFPRSFPENGYLKLEQGYSEKVATDLENKGHKIERTFNPIGGAQAIIYDEKKDILYGGSDPRKDGIALGY